MRSGRSPLLVAPELRGRQYAEALSDATDAWFQQVVAQAGLSGADIALLAVGGYGRRELCPYSDVDVILVHGDGVDGAEVAEALWYPAWDRGLKLGYAVVTIEQAKALLDEEFEWATSLQHTRLVAGRQELRQKIDSLVDQSWTERADDLMAQISASLNQRHATFGDAAFQIEPHLKEGRGGLRDTHAMAWANHAVPGFADDELAGLKADIDTLLEARVELHRLADRAGDVLSFDDQDGVAEALGDDNSQALMFRLALAARRIAWHSDEVWSRWRRSSRQEAGPIDSIWVADTSPFAVDRDLLLLTDPTEATDPMVLLRFAALAAEHDLVMDREDLTRIHDSGEVMPVPWSDDARTLFAAIFLHERSSIRVVEDLAQFGLMERLLPEWSTVLSKPQRNALHTFTVDRHLCEAAANASELVDRVGRSDLLVVGALFHDIGKGYPGDHTEVGMKVIGEIADRMGYPDGDVAVLVDLCRHHLLLPDVATRRDLSDPGTIKAVAAAVDSVEFLQLLAALTEADSLATGPSAWGTWKAGLLSELVDRTTAVLEGRNITEVVSADFPTPEVFELLERRERQLIGSGMTYTVIAPESIGLFSKMAGVLAVSGLDVIDASAYSNDGSPDEPPPTGMAACQFTIQPPQSGSVDWEAVSVLANKALDGQVALDARVTKRAREYGRFRRRLAAEPPLKDVLIDNEISAYATVVEVHGPDEIGLLYRLTQVLRELDLDIRTAKVQTFGPQAVDSFYVRTADGKKVQSEDLMSEVRFALKNVLGVEDES